MLINRQSHMQKRRATVFPLALDIWLPSPSFVYSPPNVCDLTEGKMKRGLGALAVPLFVLTVALAARPAPHPANRSPFPQQPPPPLRFTFGGNAAEIPATFIDSLVFLPVHVNQSEPSLFELDSTAAVSSIDPDRAMEIGIGRTPVPLLNLSGVDISLGSLAETA